MSLNLTNFNTNINNCRIFNYLSTNNIFTPEANISNLNAIILMFQAMLLLPVI
jgi:hypothetical protein